MARVLVTCPACSTTLSLNEKAIVLHDHRQYFSFCCTECGMSVTKEADSYIAGLLLSAGVREDDAYPEEIPDPDAPPITSDDLIDFHFELQRL